MRLNQLVIYVNIIVVVTEWIDSGFPETGPGKNK